MNEPVGDMKEIRRSPVVFTLPSSTMCYQAIESMLDPQRRASHPNIASERCFRPSRVRPLASEALLVRPRAADSPRSTCLSRLYLPDLKGKSQVVSHVHPVEMRWYRLMSSTVLWGSWFALVTVETLTDEWNRDKMSEPPPVYNLMIFPSTAGNTGTQRLPSAQGELYCS